MAKIKEAIEDFKPDSRLVGMGTTRAEEALTSTASGGATTGDQRGEFAGRCLEVFDKLSQVGVVVEFWPLCWRLDWHRNDNSMGFTIGPVAVEIYYWM
jgi:hypothetical protein